MSDLTVLALVCLAYFGGVLAVGAAAARRASGTVEDPTVGVVLFAARIFAALAGMLAAVMSTIGAQFLTLSSMASRDVLRRRFSQMNDATEVRFGRAFVVLLAGCTFAVAAARPASIPREVIDAALGPCEEGAA